MKETYLFQDVFCTPCKAIALQGNCADEHTAEKYLHDFIIESCKDNRDFIVINISHDYEQIFSDCVKNIAHIAIDARDEVAQIAIRREKESTVISLNYSPIKH